MLETKKVLVVYYSRSGTTKMVANEISTALKCDIEEIIDKKKRRGIFALVLAGRDAVFKKTTEIAATKFDPKDYDIVIIGTPTWASSIPPAIRTYVQKNMSKLNNIALFCTFNGSGELGVEKALKEIYVTEPLLSIGIKKDLIDKSNYIDKFKSLVI